MVSNFTSLMFYFLSCNGLSIILPFLSTCDCDDNIYHLIASGLFICCLFLGGGYLFFDLQFIVTPDVCGDMCLVVAL